ncbi:MAG: M42 family metallopeptidase [Anaerolineales bacterium]|jgi:tetrahedral aminopeptidase
MKSLIKKLVETAAPSGYEAPVRELIRAEIEPYADEIRVDPMGNLIARKGQGGQKIMLSAHMDEIGVMVTHVDENGFIRFISLGGVNPLTCIGTRVRFLNGQAGVIHMERLDEPGRVPPLEKLFIDVGATSKEQVLLRVGDAGVFETPFLDLGDRLVSKAMDDRIAVAVLVETMRKLSQDGPASPHELYFVFSVQEEVGLRGATTAAFGVDPDLGLAVDVTRTGDTPRSIKMEVALGKGPAIKVRDSGMLADPRVVNWMVQKAEEKNLPYQLEVLEAGTTDARAMQISRAGVPAGCLSIPCRYIHSPSETVDYSDVQNAVDLLVELLKDSIRL